MASPHGHSLPKFDNPPVVETVLGVQFRALSKMRMAHCGVYWNRIREDFPSAEERPVLPPIIERFGPRQQYGKAFQWGVTDRPETPRCWFTSGDESQVIQVQFDRFICNWQKKDKEDAYPSYQTNRARFFEAFQQFMAFAGEEKLGEVIPEQYEVIYVNHIPHLPDTDVIGMFPRCFAEWSGDTSDGWLRAPESRTLNATYVIRDADQDKGRLYVSACPALRRAGKQEIIQLKLTARGAPEAPDVQGLGRGLDLGHDWVVRAFASLTTTAMHKYWGRTQ